VTVHLRTMRLRRRPVRPAMVRERADRMLLAIGRADAELSIVLCDDETIHALNRDHRGKDRPTDVLAFALQEGPPMPGAEHLLGDVVISLETARRQARAARRTVAHEVTFLLAHGLLHLLGYDHRDEDERRVMMALTDGLVAASLPPRIRRGRPR